MISREKVRRLWNTFLRSLKGFGALLLIIVLLPAVIPFEIIGWLNDENFTWGNDVSYTVKILNRLFPSEEK